jgi:hypothetical protein
MKKFYIIIPVILMFVLSGNRGYSQAVTPKADTLQLQLKEKQGTSGEAVQAGKENANGQKAANNGTKAVKQVRGSRPDLNRAKGARPPSIVRPSGSGVPKGIGKPGGVGRKGGR